MNNYNRDERTSLRKEKLRQLRQGGRASWVFLAASFTLVLLFIIYTSVKQNQIPKRKRVRPDAKSYILGKTYYNNVYNFSLRLPTKDWRFKLLEDTKPLAATTKDENRSYLSQLQPLLRIDRPDKDEFLAWVDVGITPLAGPRSAKGVAMDSYIETLLEFEYKEIDSKTLQKPTPYASGPIKSAFYVINVPAQAPFDTWVAVFVVRDLKAFVMLARVREKDYDTYKWDLEQIFNSFQYIR